MIGQAVVIMDRDLRYLGLGLLNNSNPFFEKEVFMEIGKLLKNKIQQETDSNIDCFGLTFFGKGKFEFKCYKHMEKKVNNNIINTFFSKNENFIRCDYKIGNDMQYDIFKINNFIKNEIKYDGDINILIELLKTSQKYQNKFRLMEIGTRYDLLGKYCDLRGYFSLRYFEKVTDIKGRIDRYSESKDLMSELYEIFDIPKDYINYIENKILILEKNGYYPTMCGFQKILHKVEKKLYFELNQPDKHFDTLLQDNLCLVEDILPHYLNSEYKDIIESILIFWKYKYFMRGIAYGTLDDDNSFSIRFYFADMKHFIE